MKKILKKKGGKNMKKIGGMFCLAIIIGAVVLAITGLSKIKIFDKTDPNVSVFNVKDILKKQEELVTYEDVYEDYINYNSEQYTVFGIAIPYTDNHIECPVNGKIKYGYDIENIDVEIYGSNKTIVVKAGTPVVISHELEIENENFKSRTGILNLISGNEIEACKKGIKDRHESKCTSNGVQKRAEENAKNAIKSLLEDYSCYRVIVR